VVTDPQINTATNPQTGPITVHCAAASAQCNQRISLEIHRGLMHSSVRADEWDKLPASDD